MNQRVRVIQSIRHSPGVFELQVERNGLSFTPGDCVALYAENEVGSRPYSIASGIGESVMRFLIREMPGGEVSAYLGSRKPGDEVVMSPPFGWFRPGQAGGGAPSVFFATGTGIAPFMSYLRSHPERPPLLCRYGVRRREDIVERDWLNAVCPLQLAVSQELMDGALHGRVTDAWESVPLTAGIHYYLCGLDAMIDEVTVWLQAHGVDINRIHRECFFNAS